MKTFTLGPAAASLAAILVVVGIEPQSDEIEWSLRTLAVALPLSVSGYILLTLRERIDWATGRHYLWILSALAANIGQFALVAAIYFIIKHTDPESASLFLRIGIGAYLLFGLIFGVIEVSRMIRKSDA